VKNSIIDRLLNETTLETKIKVAIESYFIANKGGSFFIPVDDNGTPDKKTEAKNKRILKQAKPIVDLVLEIIKDHDTK
jgi:hypothetical protein